MLTRYAQRGLTWVDLIAPTAAEVKTVMDEYKLDPLIAQELLLPSPKSKAECRDDALYVILYFPAMQGRHLRPPQEIDFIIGKDFLITARYENIDPLHAFAKAFEAEGLLGRANHSHGGHLFATMAVRLYKALEAECDNLRQKLDDIEDRIFAGREREMVAHISYLGRMVHDFRRILVPHQEMIASIEPVGERLLGAGFAYHVRSILGEEARVRHTLEHLRDWLSELRETNNSLLSLKQNDIMKNLTIMAFATFPLTLIAAIFGMNTKNNPIIGSQYDFFIIVGLMLGLSTLFFLFFKYKKWL